MFRLLSAAMDTVTEARLAITIAQEGGMGIVHKSLSIEAQALEVGRVKKFESGVIKDPITVSPDMSIRQVLELTRSRGISGVPVVSAGKWSASSRTAICALRRSSTRRFPR
jgi:IMP dehydrogenase